MIPSSLNSHIINGLICLVIGLLFGIGIGYKLYQPKQVVESYAPTLELETAVALERKPDQSPPAEIKQAAKELKGKLTRTASVTLQPKPKPNMPDECECEPIVLDLGVVDVGTGNRVVVNTDDAEIIDGTDNPLTPYTAARRDKWEVGVIAPVDYLEGVGPAVARRMGPFKLGVAAMRQRDEGWTGMVSATISF